MSQVRMDCQAQVLKRSKGSGPKSCRGGNVPGKGCVPTDMVCNNSYYDLPNISSVAPKKRHVKMWSQTDKLWANERLEHYSIKQTALVRASQKLV
ncbi:hypothetical protein TNCV_473381 [Trichonephila clavipes]|nr:hypothetical protein TNCV_473381 [Trichonephila clavipes]